MSGGGNAAADFIHEAEMGFECGEFLRALPAAAKPFRIEKQSDFVYQLSHDTRRILLTLQPQSSRALGAMLLPVIKVKLEFFGFDRACFEKFLRHYQRHLQKGGG